MVCLIQRLVRKILASTYCERSKKLFSYTPMQKRKNKQYISFTGQFYDLVHTYVEN